MVQVLLTTVLVGLSYTLGWVFGFLRGIRLKRDEITLVEAELERLRGSLMPGDGRENRVVVIPSLREQAKRKREVAETELKTPEEWRKENE